MLLAFSYALASQPFKIRSSAFKVYRMSNFREKFKRYHHRIISLLPLGSIFAAVTTSAVLIIYILWQFQQAQQKRVERLQQKSQLLEEQVKHLSVDSSNKISPTAKIGLQKEIIGLEKDLVSLEKDIFGTTSQALGGSVIFLSLFFTWRSIQISKSGQITDRFTKAVEQLSSSDNDLTARLGGIYALERIAKDSERDHWIVMEVLIMYIREKTSEENKLNRPSSDIQAALWVLGRRVYTREAVNPFTVVYLSRAYLKGANLFRAHFEQAWMPNINLEDSKLQEIHLERANLSNARLQRADLSNAQLQGANLSNAQLQGANLSNANLEGATLVGTHLEGVDLTKTKGLEQKQIESAFGDLKTKLSPGSLEQPGTWNND
jgi:hypothetical protein